MDKAPGSSKKQWRLRRGITEEDIDAFAQRYRNSSDEKIDIRDAYIKGRGSMDYILEHVMCSTVSDEPRIRVMIESMIEQKTVPAFERFTRDDSDARESRKRKANEEAIESKRIRQEMGTMSQRREQNFSEFLCYLEDKYKDEDSDGDHDYTEEESSEEESDVSEAEEPVVKRNKC